MAEKDKAGLNRDNAERNKAVVRRALDEIWNKGNLDYADEICTPDCVIHSAPGRTIAATRNGGAKRFVAANREAFPDLQLTIDDLIAEGDKVVARFRVSGTQKGFFMGNAPTDKRGEVWGLSIWQLEDGKIREGWGILDAMAVMGVLSAPDR